MKFIKEGKIIESEKSLSNNNGGLEFCGSERTVIFACYIKIF